MRLRAQGRKILVVDDAVEILDLMALVLEKRGYEVWCSENGKDAWEKIQASTPDLILADILMPGMDGLELCDLVKSDSRFSAIPFILMTSATADSDISDGFWRIGTRADGFFSKPFNPLEVAAMVDHLVLGIALPKEIFDISNPGGGAARVRKA